MSATRTTGPTAPVEKKRGLSKYMSKVKAVLQRGDSSKKQQPPITSPVAQPAREEGPSPVIAGPSARQPAPPPPEPEKVQKLAERHGTDLGPEDWISVSAAERVEKTIRLRVHRTCHCCKTTFGSIKVCANCGHARCEQCPRYPAKKASGDKGKGVVTHEGKIRIIAEKSLDVEGLGRKQKYVLTIPSKTGGQNLVQKKPTQRVRRTCHLCQAVYQAGNKTCAQCHHIRCSDCPRDPPKPHKYPYGYPGDVLAPEGDAGATTTGEKVKKPGRARFYCHACNNVFRAKEQTCWNCGHTKCASCSRVTPRKVEPEPDPDIVNRVRDRLAAMGLTSTSLVQPSSKG